MADEVMETWFVGRGNAPMTCRSTAYLSTAAVSLPVQVDVGQKHLPERAFPC